jgi:hypothetical protein
MITDLPPGREPVLRVACHPQGEGQMPHKFRVGQQVELVRKAAEAFPPSGPYEVVRQVPNVEGELGYRIKSAAEPHERAVPESRLKPLGSRQPS